MPAWNLQDVRYLAYLEGGYSNENHRLAYQDQTYVLRIPGRTQPWVDRRHEGQYLSRVRRPLAIPPTAFDEASGLMLSPWVEGTLLVDAWARFDNGDLIDYLHALHGALPVDTRVYDVDLLVSMYTGDARTAERTPQDRSSVDRVCHNDLNPWNVIVTPDRGWVTLDWESVGLNDPLFDLVGLHQGLGLPAMELNDLARAYLNSAGREIDERLHRARVNFWRREWAWAEYQIKAGDQRAEIATQRDIAKARLSELKV